jgi:hypothetical protein
MVLTDAYTNDEIIPHRMVLVDWRPGNGGIVERK